MKLINQNSLIVIIRRLPKNKTISNDFLIINDVFLYGVLNGDIEFNSKRFNYDDYEKLTDEIINFSRNKNVILHTFNPMFLNYFPDDLAIDKFHYYSKKIDSFDKVFNHKDLLNKLKTLALGDVILDIINIQNILD